MNGGDELLDSETTATRAGTSGRLFRLIRKELSEILRDRRTILTLVLMPLLLYPLLSIAFQQFLLASTATSVEKKDALRLGFLRDADESDFVKALGTIGDLPLEQRKKLAPLNDLESAVKPDSGALMEMLFKREIDVIVVAIENAAVPGDAGREWELYYLEDSYRSKKVFHQLGERLAVVSTDIFLKNAQLPRVGAQFRFLTIGKPLSMPRQQEEFPLGSVVPLILILMTITGAVYPAIDLTAGERERGTLEILVAAPVPRLGLLFAKYVTVVAIAVLTALINLISMTLTVWIGGLGKLLIGDTGLTPLLVLEIFGLLLLFAAFFSAVLLTLTSFARSFKEAQALLIPLMLVSLAPGLAGMIPGLALSPVLCLVPLLNIVLLGRDLFANTANPLLACLVVFSTLVYAVAAIAVAARVFGSEDVLYNNQSGWAELFRRPVKPRPAASVPNALFCLCVVFSIFFIAQGTIRQFLSLDLARPETAQFYMLLVPLLSVALFAGVPLCSALLRRVRLSTGLLLRPAPVLAFLGAILLGLSLWPLVLELLTLFHILGWTTMSHENQERLRTAARQLNQTLPLWLLLLNTVVPAVVEELFFRGFLFAALQRVASAATTIVVCAVLFGFFHVAIGEGFGLERLLPSTLMGLVLGWVCWRSGSVLPAMLLHGCHNALLAWIGHALASNGQTGAATMSAESAHLPLLWLLAGAVGTLLGVGLLLLSRRHAPANLETPD